MARYIEEENLIEEIMSLRIYVSGKDVFPDVAKESVLRIIKEQPTADVMEVVRCKDCVYFHKKVGIGFGQCSNSKLLPYPEDFCSYGERKVGHR